VGQDKCAARREWSRRCSTRPLQLGFLDLSACRRTRLLGLKRVIIPRDDLSLTASMLYI